MSGLCWIVIQLAGNIDPSHWHNAKASHRTDKFPIRAQITNGPNYLTVISHWFVVGICLFDLFPSVTINHADGRNLKSNWRLQISYVENYYN